MRQSQRANIVIVGAMVLITGTLLFYASVLLDWAKNKTDAPSQEDSISAAKADLPAARLHFRQNFLDPTAHLRLSEALYRAGRPIDAFYVMHAAAALFGEPVFERAHALVVLYRNGFFLGQGDYDPSPANESRLKARLAAEPGKPDVLNYLAHIAAGRGQLKEALALLETGLAQQPNDRGLLAYRAELAAASGDTATAVAYRAKLIAAHPATHETRQALESLGQLAQKPETGPEGEFARVAKETLEELARASPDDPSLFSTLAMAVWGRGDISSVRAMTVEALNRRPGQAGALMIAGALALLDRQPEKAIAHFTSAWEKNPDDLYSAAKLAQLYFKQRADREAALLYYIALYRRNPRYDDGESAERRIRETLDIRREQLTRLAGPEALGRFFESEDASLRAQACVKAAQFADPRWIETLAELLDDDTDIVRHNADYALYQIAKNSPDAVRVRRDEWLTAGRPLMQARALNLFADLNPQETFPFVARALRDPSPAVRFFARVMVLDHYYKNVPLAEKTRAEYFASEKDPAVLSLYGRLSAAKP